MMRTIRMALMAALLAVPSTRAAAQAPSVAVLPFQSGGAFARGGVDTRAMEQELASSLARALGGAGKAVSGAELERALAGTSLGTEGRIDAASAAKVGAAVGATHVVAGTFMDHFGKVRLDARVIDVRTGRVVKTASAGPGDRAEMTAMVNQLAAQVRAAAGG
jgi:TolB-like protein